MHQIAMLSRDYGKSVLEELGADKDAGVSLFSQTNIYYPVYYWLRSALVTIRVE